MGADVDIRQDMDDDSAPVDRYRAPALDKGLDILEVLSDQPHGLTRAEIVKELGLGPSQIYRMLERLVARGYVARIAGDRYALTMKIFLLATRHPPLRRLMAQAQPLMDEFARDMRQSCHLVVPEQGAAVVVAQASPPGHWEFRARVGGQLDLFATGSGLTLLAFQHPDRIQETMGLWGVRNAPKKLKDVAGELEVVRKAAIRIAPSGQMVGVTDISVPVLAPSGDAAGVLTCAYIEHPEELGTDVRSKAIERLVRVAAELSSAV